MSIPTGGFGGGAVAHSLVDGAIGSVDRAGRPSCVLVGETLMRNHQKTRVHGGHWMHQQLMLTTVCWSKGK